jgi:hypothetical protein
MSIRSLTSERSVRQRSRNRFVPELSECEARLLPSAEIASALSETTSEIAVDLGPVPLPDLVGRYRGLDGGLYGVVAILLPRLTPNSRARRPRGSCRAIRGGVPLLRGGLGS